MTLKNKLVSLAAPVVIAVVWDTVCLAARIIGIYRTIQENPSLFNGGEALEQLMRAIAEDIAEQDRRAA